VVDAYSRIVKLGEGLTHSGELSEPAMDRAIEALEGLLRPPRQAQSHENPRHRHGGLPRGAQWRGISQTAPAKPLACRWK
jgi:hypothetical protein